MRLLDHDKSFVTFVHELAQLPYSKYDNVLYPRCVTGLMETPTTCS